MNRQAKSAIKSLVLTLRHKLEEDISIQLKRYGFAGERWLPLERLPHIQRDDRATIEHYRLKAALEQHLRRIGAEPPKATAKQRTEAVDWFVREVAFTHLNRLVALKCLEVRELISEIITRRNAYGSRARAHYDYRNAHPDEARGADDALPAAICHVCQQVYAEFKFLFDVGDPATGRQPPTHSILWPEYPVLKECIGLINGLDEAASNEGRTLWAEDEIIGWIYQFYNAEQKEAIRRRGRPRRPAEVAVINQFFTPRWIVKFLVDNTLGRLWLEMHPDSDRVRAKCDYLVPEPLKSVDSETRGSGSRLDPDSPINDPGAPSRRDPKRPQDVRLIDPACGTMHFGHYAFEVFQEIYRDAREHGWVTERDALSDGEIPAAILRHNLYGVDIDLRAVQLAGLSLFIKAKSTNPSAHIAHVNLVVADAVLPADGARQQFLDRYRDDKVVQDAVRQMLDEMANVAEVGSLLRVEERLRDLLRKAGHAAAEGWDTQGQRELPGFGVEMRQLSLAETAGAVPEQWGAHYTLARLVDDLRTFAAEALRTHNLNAQLFVEEAEKTVHLLDVFLNEYCVAVMNPPYGDTTGTAKSYLAEAYPEAKNDLYAAFMDRGLDWVAGRGYLGALVSRTFMFLSSFAKFREQILLKRCEFVSIAELGLGVLDDATVRPAAVVLSSKLPNAPLHRPATFYRLPQIELGEKAEFLSRAVQDPTWGREASIAFVSRPARFAALSKSPFTYWASEDVLDKFVELPPLDKDNLSGRSDERKVADVKEGLGTRDDARFVRFFWEVKPLSVGTRWFSFAKGGDCLRYYKEIDWIVDWDGDGEAIKRNIAEKYPYLDGKVGWLVKNTDYYFREGASYTRESEKATLGVYHMPEGCIFSDKGPAIFFPTDDFWWGLAVLNSALVAGFLRMLTPDRSRPIGLVSSFPVAVPNDGRKQELQTRVSVIYQCKAAWDTGNEVCSRFDTVWLVQAHQGTLLTDFPDLQPSNRPTGQLAALLGYIHAVEEAADVRLQVLQAEIDDLVYDLYEISVEDRAAIERELGDRPPELVWPQMEGKSDREKRREHVRRLLSYFLLHALQEKRDGILPVTTGTGQPTALDEIRSRLEAEFGEAPAFRMEAEIKQVLGQSIAKWLDGPFCKWHTKLYKRRPVIWHLASLGNHFACFLHIHKLDRDTLRKVQTLYLWPRRRAAQTELDAARAAQSPRRMEEAEIILDDLAEFEKRLLSVIQAQVVCDIPDWAEGPYRDGIYDPVLDDGVLVNITPLQEAQLLRYKKVV